MAGFQKTNIAVVCLTLLTCGQREITPPSKVLFRSDWSTATGNSLKAVLDNDRWYTGVCGHQDVLRVVPGSSVGWTGTVNALQVMNRGESRCWKIETEAVPPRQSFYVRFYARLDNAFVTTFHSVALGAADTQTSLWSIESAAGDGYAATIRYSRASYNDQGWKCDTRIARGKWYRFEYHIEIVGPKRHKVWPRVYDASGKLICQAQNYRHLDGGRRTLADYNNAGGAPYTDSERLRAFALGYEGTGGNNENGARWQYAAVEIRSDTWPGPVR